MNKNKTIKLPFNRYRHNDRNSYPLIDRSKKYGRDKGGGVLPSDSSSLRNAALVLLFLVSLFAWVAISIFEFMAL